MAYRQPARAVLLGVDGSAGDLAATELAVDEAVHRRLPLRIAYATPLGHPQSNPPRMPERVTDFLEGVHRAHPDLDITERIAPMPSSRLLLEESAHAALIVVGSPSAGADGGTDPSRTAEVVMAGAECPVVVAPRR